MMTARLSEVGSEYEFGMQKLLALLLLPQNEMSSEQIREKAALLQVLPVDRVEAVNQQSSFISQHGREQWLAQFSEGQTFDFDGFPTSIP